VTRTVRAPRPRGGGGGDVNSALDLALLGDFGKGESHRDLPPKLLRTHRRVPQRSDRLMETGVPRCRLLSQLGISVHVSLVLRPGGEKLLGYRRPFDHAGFTRVGVVEPSFRPSSERNA
jgi:hypothetical protein